jgi:hypothetical protein
MGASCGTPPHLPRPGGLVPRTPLPRPPAPPPCDLPASCEPCLIRKDTWAVAAAGGNSEVAASAPCWGCCCCCSGGASRSCSSSMELPLIEQPSAEPRLWREAPPVAKRDRIRGPWVPITVALAELLSTTTTWGEELEKSMMPALMAPAIKHAAAWEWGWLGYCGVLHCDWNPVQMRADNVCHAGHPWCKLRKGGFIGDQLPHIRFISPQTHSPSLCFVSSSSSA